MKNRSFEDLEGEYYRGWEQSEQEVYSCGGDVRAAAVRLLQQLPQETYASARGSQLLNGPIQVRATVRHHGRRDSGHHR